jgi:hypothetical protein
MFAKFSKNLILSLKDFNLSTTRIVFGDKFHSKHSSIIEQTKHLSSLFQTGLFVSEIYHLSKSVSNFFY